MLNFNLMKTWQNWFIILLMVYIGLFGVHIVTEYLKGIKE